jgi:hypothetical protein
MSTCSNTEQRHEALKEYSQRRQQAQSTDLFGTSEFEPAL